ncbi:MAG: TIGR01212 family radical SAM protein [Bacteroidia bacterium]|nr:MAG: TIGR01212 family radical SAM protein [Bacteroidia bacterium]
MNRPNGEQQDAKTYPWGDQRPIYTYTQYIRRLFGARVQKLTIDAGFSCPHRGDRLDQLGCTYCRNEAFNPSYCTPRKSVAQQLREGMEFHARRYRRASRYLAYFQAYTNTLAPLAELRELYGQALHDERVLGLVIGTRPDCLPDDIIGYLADIARTHHVFVELGAESMHDSTLLRVNRGHDARTTRQAVENLHAAGLRVGLHLIFGLPGEDEAMMLQSLRQACALPIASLKFHQLQILEGTAMAKDYELHPADYPLFTLEGYLNFLTRAVPHVPPTVAIERICAEAPPRYLIAPLWERLRNDQILRRFEALLQEQGFYQGCARSEADATGSRG